MGQHFPAPLPRPAEAGYILVTVMFLLAVFTLGLSVAVPVITRQIQLDRERETIERGKQYQRAIQLYYRKFHAYPANLDALVDTSNIRFLRKRYLDPMTRKDDWRPILYGQNKAPTAMGFFGQPLTGMGSNGASTLAGIGPSGGNEPGTSSPAATSSPFNSTGTSLGGSSFYAPSPTSGNSGAPGLGSSTAFGQDSLNISSNAQTFGGAGIIGVSPASSEASIMTFKRKARFDEWEFTYDPMTDIALLRNNTVPIQPSAGSLVGNGSGLDGTGPIASAPNLTPQGSSNLPEQ